MSNINDFVIENGVLQRYTGSDREVVIPEEVIEVGNNAFKDLNISKIIIPDHVREFDGQSTYGCRNLEYNIYDNAKYLGNENNPYRFLIEAIAHNIESCDIHEKTEWICSFAFSGCSALTQITGGDGLIAIGDDAFWRCENLRHINVPNSVQSIGGSAFQYCMSLEPFDLPQSLISVGAYAFMGVPWKNVRIPSSVAEIGSCAFRNCTEVDSITVDKSNKVYHSDGNCLIKTATKELVLGCKNSIIPEDGSVVSIGDSAFFGCQKLKSIIVSETVTTIGENAFCDCSELETIQLPDGITNIGWGTFSGCKRLKSIVLPKELTKIEPHMFDRDEALECVTMFDAVTEIGRNAFSDCINLRDINLSNSIIKLSNDCFSQCKSLKGITLPASLVRIESGAFAACTSISNIVIPKNAYEMHALAFTGTDPVCISVELGNPVYYSDGNCLINRETRELILGCENSIIPSDGSVTRILNSAFSGCKKRLTSIQIPDSVKRIEKAFQSSALQHITIPQGVTRLEWGAFRQCENLESAVIPASVTEIEQEAFNLCGKLSRLEIYGSPKIANHSFEGIQLSFFKAPELVATNGFAWWKERFGEVNTYIAAFDNFDVGSKIAKYAKKNYKDAFKALIMRNRIDLLPNFLSMWKEFDLYVFERLVDIAVCEQKTEYVAFLMEWKQNNAQNSAVAYQLEFQMLSNPLSVTEMKKMWLFEKNEDGTLTITGYKGDENIVHVPEKIGKTMVSAIGDYAFSPNKSGRTFSQKETLKNITEIIIPNSVSTIGVRAFNDCKALTAVTIPEGVKTICRAAFSGCSSLTTVNIPKSVTEIEDSAFKGCTSIVSIVIPEGIQYISAAAFEECSSLVTVDIPKTVIRIDRYAFYKCRSLTNIVFPIGLKQIDTSAFVGCIGMANESGLLIINNSLINYFGNSADVIVPDGITNICPSAFLKSKISTISLPDGITDIGSCAFANCTSLKNINIPNSVKSIGEKAFWCCTSLEDIVIPESVKFIKDDAFAYCGSKKILCEIDAKPRNWTKKWNPDNISVVWGHKR